MSFQAAEKIADAVLFEGYMLYPYRPSALKNRQRWNFGTLYPRAFAETRQPAEPHSFHAAVLLQASPSATIDVRARFLELVPQPGADSGWQVGVVRARTLEGIRLDDIEQPVQWALDWTALSDEEKARAPQSYVERPSKSWLQLKAVRVDEKHFRIQAAFSNETPMEDAAQRSEAQAGAFTSAHLLLHCAQGAFVSLLEPAPELAAAVAECRNQGVSPVLAGDPDGHTMLCSPIILYDHPQIAPESGGDFFDATEMDEMLALRVLTLTDEEKREMRESDPHARAILERVEAMAEGGLLAVHGAIRDVAEPGTTAATPQPDRPVDGHVDEGIDVPIDGHIDAPVDGHADGQIDAQIDGHIEGYIDAWDPFADGPVLESAQVFGAQVRKGDRVRLWPQKQADIMDSVMAGRIATIEAIEQDLEGNVQFAVVLEDDPGKDLGLLRQAGHRFFFSPHEVEPLTLEAHG